MTKRHFISLADAIRQHNECLPKDQFPHDQLARQVTVTKQLTVRSGYDSTSATYRNPESLAEMIQWCDGHSHITLLDIHGRARNVKINGRVRTWKRDAGRIEVPYKYGLYEYGVLSASDINRVLIPVSETV